MAKCGLFSLSLIDLSLFIKGGENVLVWEAMEELRGEPRGSYITGSSARNQRIERPWRDVWAYVCHQFYYTFQALEEEGQS